MTRRLVVLAKPPLPGVAKTRLAASLGAEAAAGVAAALLLDTVTLCERFAHAVSRGLSPGCGSAPEPVELVLAYTHERLWFETHLAAHWRLLQQRGEGLDRRIDCVLDDLCVAADDLTLFLGMDSPHLPPERPAEAFAALQSAGTVLGPCEDGGYYLIGVRGRWPHGTLARVRFGTDRAFADTAEALAAAGLSCAVLAAGYDVDDLESLRRLARDCEGPAPDLPARTRAELARLKQVASGTLRAAPGD